MHEFENFKWCNFLHNKHRFIDCHFPPWFNMRTNECMEVLQGYKTEKVILRDRKLQRLKVAIIKSHFSHDNKSYNYQDTKEWSLRTIFCAKIHKKIVRTNKKREKIVWSSWMAKNIVCWLTKRDPRWRNNGPSLMNKVWTNLLGSQSIATNFLGYNGLFQKISTHPSIDDTELGT